MRCGCCTFLLHPLPQPFTPGHPPDRRQTVPRKITVQSGAKRRPKDASEASALYGDLVSAQDCSAGRMAVPCADAVGGRDGGQPVTGRGRGSARAAARRAPPGAKAELPAR